MVLLVAGALILLAGVHHARVTRILPGATAVPGRVVHVERKRSSLPGSPGWNYGPTIEYRDPASGAVTTLPPAAYRSRPYEVGEDVVVMHHAETGQVRLPLHRPRAQTALPFVLAALVLALGVHDLVG